MSSRPIGTLTLLLTALSACGGSNASPKDGAAGADGGTLADAGDGGDVGTGGQPVQIRFVARVGAAPFACGQNYPGLGIDNADTQPADLRFYVQDVALLDEQGRATPVTLTDDGRWQQATVGLLDFENKQGECANGTEPTNDRLVGTVAPGRYRGLRFTVGVPFALNHRQLTDSRPPLDLTALFWSWNAGHLFLKAEASAVVASAGADAGATGDAMGDANADAAGQALPMDALSDVAADAGLRARRNVFAFHAGSVMCAGNASEGALVACARPNRATIELPTFDPTTNKVVVDFAEIFAESRLQSLAGCHSFSGGDACTAPFRRMGVDPATGQPSPGTQKVFRAE
ncbi:MAG TPA: MbnP family copper-binding protein [Polyangia bacterium]